MAAIIGSAMPHFRALFVYAVSSPLLPNSTVCVISHSGTSLKQVTMTLPEYIEQVGDAAAARLFRVKPRTAMAWRLGERHPRPAKAAEIVRVLGGAVTFEGCYARRASR